jgi:hypothetical protein
MKTRTRCRSNTASAGLTSGQISTFGHIIVEIVAALFGDDKKKR